MTKKKVRKLPSHDLMPSRIYYALWKEKIERPISKGRPMNLHKWTLAIRKRRQAGHRKALVLHSKPKLKRTRKRAIAKAQSKTRREGIE